MTKTDKERLEWKVVPVGTILPGIDIRGMATIEDIRRGDYCKKIPVGDIDKWDEGARPLVDAVSLNQADERIMDFFSPLQGQVLVDLGCSDNNGGYHFARYVGARGYIGIEPGSAKSAIERLEASINRDREFYEGRKPCIPAGIIAEDMLTALRRFPSGSTSVLASAIDWLVLQNNDDYIHEVEREVRRVLSPKGAFINHGSCFCLHDLKEDRCGGVGYTERYTR